MAGSNGTDIDGGRVATVLLALAGALVAFVVAGDVFPFRSLNHDEGVYLQQADVLLSGRLFFQPPVDGPFRPWFFVESEQGLYSKYAPVPAAVFALGRLLGGYTLALAGIAVGLVVGTVALGRELFDARVGVVAGILLLGTPLFVLHSGLFLPYLLTTTLNVAFAVWYLRGERRERIRDATLAGAAVGLASFTRPYTAVLFALPFVGHAVVTLATTGAWRVPFAAGDAGTDDDAGDAGIGDATTRGLFARRVVTATLGTVGVLVALGYNAVVTGDPLVFPYLAFAPSDGVGFGERALLGHVVNYTPSLAIEATRLVLIELFTEWVVAGSLGTVAAAVGIGVTLLGRRVPGDGPGDDQSNLTTDENRIRRSLLAGTVLTIVAGNLAFWGNFNILGTLDAADDGLIHYLGPYYHFDLVVPTAVFAAVACVAGIDRLSALAGRVVERREKPDRFSTRQAQVVVTAVVLVVALAAVPLGAAPLTAAVDRNVAVSDELRAGYGPLAGDERPTNAVVFLPTPYGPWLNHPFQVVRNDADFDGPTLYALGDVRELSVAEAFPDRDLYRYVYAGTWSPTDESTVRSEIQSVDRVAGERIELSTTVGRPTSAERTTIRVTSESGSAYFVATDAGGPLSMRMVAEGDRLTVSGDTVEPSGDGNGSIRLDDADEVDVEVYVATGPASGYSYRIVFPVGRDDGRIRALSPTVERCPVPTRCVPQGVGESPPNRSVDVTLSNETTAERIETADW